MAKPSSYATAQTLFLADLARNLFANNQFLLQSRNWSVFANAKDVVWNRSGAKPGVVINRDTVALTAAKRTDVKRSYELDEYQSIPSGIDWTDEMVINYAKRQDIINDHRKQMDNDIAMRILYNWTKGYGKLLRTTGSAKAGGSPSATGNRKLITIEDFLAARLELNKMEIEDDGRRVAVVPANLEADILKIKDLWSSFVSKDDIVMRGAITKIAGFNIFMRSTGIVFNNAGTPVAQSPKADDTLTARAGAATDNESVLCYHPDYVTRAISPSSLFSIINVHGGLEASATMIAGGDKFYNSGEGIVVIVEDAAA